MQPRFLSGLEFDDRRNDLHTRCAAQVGALLLDPLGQVADGLGDDAHADAERKD